MMASVNGINVDAFVDLGNECTSILNKFSAEKLSLKYEYYKEMLENGIIKPPTSPCVATIVIDKKKYGEDRICVGYRKLNEKTIKDHYRLPNIWMTSYKDWQVKNTLL